MDAYKSVLLQLFRDFSDASGETVLSLRRVQHHRPLEGLEIEDGVVWYLHEAGTACERDIAGRGFPGLEQVSDVVKEKLFVHGFEQVTRGLNRVSLQGVLGRSRDEEQGHVGIQFSDLARRIQAIDFFHAHIQDDEVKSLAAPIGLKKFVSAGKRHDPHIASVSQFPQIAPEQFQITSVVVTKRNVVHRSPPPRCLWLAAVQRKCFPSKTSISSLRRGVRGATGREPVGWGQ